MKGLHVVGVSHAYGDKQVLDNASLLIPAGEVVCLLGPSGSGKTTLLRLAGGLERLQKGRIAIDDEIVADKDTHVAPEHRGIGLMFQDYALFPHLYIIDNVTFGLFGQPKDQARRRAMDMLDQVGMTRHATSYPHRLSGGQQQRVALVRALATRPTLLLLDEPLSHLDPELRDSVRTELLKLFRETDTTVLFVSHDIEDAMAMADRMVVMREGAAEQIGTPGEVYDRPVSQHVARLFGKTNFIPAGLLPNAPHSIPSENGTGRVVPVRPHQWRVSDRSPAFSGTVQSVTNRGSHREETLATEHLALTIHLTEQIVINTGDALTVSCTLPD